MQIAMIKDVIVPFSELSPAHTDRGIYFGDGVYEVLRSYNGRIFALDEHLARLARSLTAIEIAGIDIKLIRQRIEQAFARADIADARIYFHITRGSEPRKHVGSKDLTPNFFLTVTELPDTTEEKTNGIAVSTYPDLRWKRCDIKSLNLLANVMARNDAAKKGCAEAILVDETELITEGAGSAFFAITNKTVRTAPLTANILPSITRRFAIKAAEELGLKVRQEQLTPRQADAADELFIAVTTRDIVGAVEFDGKQIGNGKVGKYTTMLIEKFADYVTRTGRFTKTASSRVDSC